MNVRVADQKKLIERPAISRYVFAILAITVIVGAIIGVTVLVTSSNRQVLSAPSSAAAGSSNGIELNVEINSTKLAEGQRLNLSIALLNTLPAPNNITTSNDDWTMHGFPVAIWPPCSLNLPVEFDILAGNYYYGQIQAMNPTYENATAYACADSYSVQYVAFQAESDHVNLTGLVGVNNHFHSRMVGSYDLATNFTVSGYWWYPITSADQGDLNTPVPGSAPAQFTFQYPEVSPTDYMSFKSGTYTLVVGDEWGQMILLHFTVNS